METAARWTPLTPEMEAKVMFGRHIWDFAQMADALGKRTFELRLPEQHSCPAVDAYEALLEDVAMQATTESRVAALYDAVVPGLIARAGAYAKATDAILDEPSVMIIERMIGDLRRHRGEATELRRLLGLGGGQAAALAARERAIAHIVTETEPA
jgi:hypothetical protein